MLIQSYFGTIPNVIGIGPSSKKVGGLQTLLSNVMHIMAVLTD